MTSNPPRVLLPCMAEAGKWYRNRTPYDWEVQGERMLLAYRRKGKTLGEITGYSYVFQREDMEPAFLAHRFIMGLGTEVHRFTCLKQAIRFAKGGTAIP